MADLIIPIDWDLEATFRSRPNRFLARVEIPGEEGEVDAHVHDPGRLKEILISGNKVIVRKGKNVKRKTGWDLIAGRVEDNWILINSSFHRKISQTLLSDRTLNPFGPFISLRPEVKVGKSRLDYLMIDDEGNDLYIEVKGCSLTLDGRALFPDAPTTRGRRHLEELIELRQDGVRGGMLILVIGPKADCFSPNFETDPKFSETFIEAVKAGVEVHPVQFELIGREMLYRGPVPLCPDIFSK